MTFSLVTEPWIPVVLRNTEHERLSLKSIFERADEIRTLSPQLPTQRFALMRVLLAILHRSVRGPVDLDHWREIYESWDRVVEIVHDYLDEHLDRFDLLHAEHPFMQVAELHTSKDEVFSLERLHMDTPNNAKFFSMRKGALVDRLSYADAALALINSQAFDESGIKSGAVGDPRVKGGRGYPIGTGWCGNLQGILAEGSNLKEALLLNLLVPGQAGFAWMRGDYSFEGEDLPSWEREWNSAPRGADPTNARDNFAEGFIDLYTWQARRVRLVDDGSAIRGVVLCNGDKFLPQNSQHIEPFSTFRYSKPQSEKAKATVFMPGTMAPGNSVWRGIDSLIASGVSNRNTQEGIKPVHPPVVEFTRALVEEGLLPDNTQLKFSTVAVEYGPNSSGYSAVYVDHLSFPSFLIATLRGDYANGVANLVQRIDQVSFAFSIFADELASAAGDRNSASSRNSARDELFSKIDRPVRDWLLSLSTDETIQDAIVRMESDVQSVVRELVHDRVSRVPESALAGREVGGQWVSAGTAQAKLQNQVRKILGHAPVPGQVGVRDGE